MPTQTDIDIGEDQWDAKIRSDLKIPDSSELYDQIMVGIEPELTTNQLPLLEAKYASETPEETKARMERYNQAFKKFCEAYEAYMTELRRKLTSYVHTAFASAEKDDRSVELQNMQNLEAMMNSL